MAFIPEDKLLEIKDAARIEEVVGQYVQLTQKGKNLLGLCPFHADTSPSFTVAPEKGIFHCFGCGAGGNVFSFLMQHQRLSFPEAVSELARRYGIPLTFKELGPEGSRETRKRTLAYEINQVAAGFYEATLKSATGRPGRDYLAKRGLTPEVIQAFHLGYAPDEWDSLRRHLQNRGLSLEAAQEGGLLAPRSGGGFYDRFRNRIIFPIFDRQSRVLAFGGRIIGQGEPKYLNSPETQLYHKGRTLYGLPQAAEALRQTGVALVVEGYLDLIALQARGIANVLATLGTAMTREQVRLLKNLAPKVVLVYDGDAAGIKAMQRAFPLFAQESLLVRALALPPGQDPDDYAKSRGVEIFKAAWGGAQPWFSFVLEGLIGSHGLEVEGRVRILEELRPYFQAIADPVEQDLWLKTAAQRLGVDESVLRQSLASFATITASRLSPTAAVAISLEKGLLRWVLGHPPMVALEDLEQWAPEFEDEELKEVMLLIIECYREHGNLDHGLLVQRVERENLRQLICALTFTEEEGSGLSPDLLADHWRRDLEVRRLRKARAKLREEMRNANDKGGLAALQVKLGEIDGQLKELAAV
ncbi:MAG: DNA primase [Desulfobaccales bacterium]|jgi:DNA primase